MELLVNICKNCRKCCTGTSIKIYPEDITRWKDQDRLDILLSISSLLGESRQFIKKKENEECIFLKNGLCLIHDTKPKVCKEYPTNIKHGEKFDCEALHLLFASQKNTNHF
ncbi:YkgJ family cysteine cluster protein [archaeon]|nr:YkgJ family cysteine cluster protein [archaeon]MBT4022280.1 YkgJ family cysteine cluster protein [archaeon]MBT4271763.1 YkgJ family cysteine cluster protein [archaeon]MBT4461407.1 YkgJ family cysteine cluster protein [archaeon]MBT4858663.1 YkgJ family cysteine cluster protein [archaeon]